MKTTLLLLTSVLGAAALSQAQSLSNPWSGVLGDRGNMSAFAFQATAGLFPDSVSPSGALEGVPAIALTRLTLTRPDDATLPAFGTGDRQITGTDTPVYIDVYSDYSGGVFSGFLGSSSTGVAWDQTAAAQAYSYDFTGPTLAVDHKYWFVFSETIGDGDVAQFRCQLNTAGDNLTPGPGKGYLVNDTVQSLTSAAVPQDWAFAYVVDFTPVPEPSTIALGLSASLLALLGCIVRHRRGDSLSRRS
ncbi:MAG: hypothetical protein JXQ71_04925 [Verrucomicrobia bacterium]|nr:hypothetical protein [Verrucomicrobiota bacterium]